MTPPRISPHFVVSEFACHDGTPVPAAAIRPLTALCVRYLEPLRAEFGRTTIVSGHRPTRYNAEHGGAPRSQHVYGKHGFGVAADVVCERGRPTDWFRFLDALGAGGLGLYDSWVHVDNRNSRARW